MSEKVVIGNATLWHGDCREILPTLPKHDLLLTDPPYGIDYSNSGGFSQSSGWKDWRGSADWDKERPPSWLFGLMQEKAAESIIWGGNYFTDLLRPTMRWLVWDKGQRDFSLADCEFAWSSQQAAARVLTLPRAEALQDGKEHPTQKPVRLMAWCLEMHKKARTVVDPFMGTGTTGVACAQLGKAFTGIERERKYFDIACERIARAQAQGALFEPEPPKAEQIGLGLEAA